MSTKNFMVEVYFPNNSVDVASIGLYGEYMRMPVAYSSHSPEWGDTQSREGLLDESWMSVINDSVDIRRVGNYSAIGGCTVKFLAAANVIKTVRLAGLSLIGKELKVRRVDITSSGAVESVEFAASDGGRAGRSVSRVVRWRA